MQCVFVVLFVTRKAYKVLSINVTINLKDIAKICHLFKLFVTFVFPEFPIAGKLQETKLFYNKVKYM